MSDEKWAVVYTCPKCGLADSGAPGREIRCAGVVAWGTAHKPATMEPVS